MRDGLTAVTTTFTAAALLCSSFASAETLTVTGWANGYKDVSITRPEVVRAEAGAFLVTDGISSFQAWCVDLPESTFFGLAVDNYFSSRSLFETATVDKLEQLATGFLSMATDATNSATFQLAAWEVINDRSGTYEFDAGSFQANGGSAESGGALTTALDWLGSPPTTSNYSASFWVGPTNQDLVVVSPAPEPGTSSLLLAGLGLMGLIARRRIAARKEPG